MNKKINALIVDDSAFIRKLLKDLFLQDKDFFKVETAINGQDALKKLDKQPYDVITLDVEMPVMNGIETLKKIMDHKPTPVIMFSTLTQKGTTQTVEALTYGAVDIIAKPSNFFNLQNKELHSNILEKVKKAATIRLPTSSLRKNVKTNIKQDQLSSSQFDYSKLNTRTKKVNPRSSMVKKIVAIGTSTGGPRALQEVISNLSYDIHVPVLIVQHMPTGFTKSLAERLNTLTQLQVKEAENNEKLMNGTVYIAPGDKHLNIKQTGLDQYIIHLKQTPTVSGHRPSVDDMFLNISDFPNLDIIAVIMTGMGADGAKGMLQLKQSTTATTIAEDESSCIVFGMPKSAIQLGGVDKIVPLNNIAHEINRLLEV